MELFKRETYLNKIRGFYNDTDVIKVFTGVRRCGKSSIMKMGRDEILQKGCKAENIIFIDLDEKKYRKIKTDDQLENLIDSLSVSDGLKYLFVDEIQNVQSFEDVLNGIRGKEYSIFITGSNSYLLSGELMTKLTGRYIEFEMFPLNFYEYLSMKKFLGQPTNHNLYAEFENFIREGGFPKTLEYESQEDKMNYVKSVVTQIYDKDIHKNNKIRD